MHAACFTVASGICPSLSNAARPSFLGSPRVHPHLCTMAHHSSIGWPSMCADPCYLSIAPLRLGLWCCALASPLTASPFPAEMRYHSRGPRSQVLLDSACLTSPMRHSHAAALSCTEHGQFSHLSRETAPSCSLRSRSRATTRAAHLV